MSISIENCNRDCFNCTKEDCFVDEITEEEMREQDLIDREIRHENETDKRKRTQNKYNRSDKGKASRMRYAKSEKGKANMKRAQQRRIESGKNAEYCMRYYYKKKRERELQEILS